MRGSAPARKGNPVILVHGMLGQRHLYWNFFARRLKLDGFRVHEAELPYFLLGDMRIAARFLKEKVEATLRGDRAAKVDLVCHSAGGLVARYYLKYLGGDKQVAHLVTLGTPHQGTYFSYVLGLPFLRILKQTRPGSNFLQEIAGPEQLPASVRVTNFWAALDVVIVPSYNGVLPGARNVRVPLAGHWDFLWRRDIHDLIVDSLVDGHGHHHADQPADIPAALAQVVATDTDAATAEPANDGARSGVRDGHVRPVPNGAVETPPLPKVTVRPRRQARSRTADD